MKNLREEDIKRINAAVDTLCEYCEEGICDSCGVQQSKILYNGMYDFITTLKSEIEVYVPGLPDYWKEDIINSEMMDNEESSYLATANYDPDIEPVLYQEILDAVILRAKGYTSEMESYIYNNWDKYDGDEKTSEDGYSFNDYNYFCKLTLVYPDKHEGDRSLESLRRGFESGECRDEIKASYRRADNDRYGRHIMEKIWKYDHMKNFEKHGNII